MPNIQSITVLVDDFGDMPQGGDVLADGTFISVDVHSGVVTGWSGKRGLEPLTETSPGPIALVAGSDDCVYLAHTGGRIGDFWRADHEIHPGIQQIRLGERSEPATIVVQSEGVPLVSPHDLAWGADGRLWVADSHIWEWEPERRHETSGSGRIIAIDHDGVAQTVVDTGVTFPAGIAAEPDGSIVWTEGYTDRVRRVRPDGTVETVAQLPEGHVPHGIAVATDGSLWVTSFGSSTLDVISADGNAISHLLLGDGDRPMNLAFDGAVLYIVEFLEEADEEMKGRLLRVETDTEGIPVFRGALDARPLP